MCSICGCGGDAGHPHHGDALRPTHVHAPGMDGRRMVRIEQDILAKNQRHADANRRYLAEQGIMPWVFGPSVFHCAVHLVDPAGEELLQVKVC